MNKQIQEHIEQHDSPIQPSIDIARIKMMDRTIDTIS